MADKDAAQRHFRGGGGRRMTRRVAVGAGIGREHLHAYQNLPERFEVAVVCDRDEARARDIAAGAGIATAGAVEDVLAEDSIDVFDVCLPPFLHLPVSVQALEAGKHVVCEKPMVTSLREADQLAAAIAASGRVFSPVFQYRFGPGMAKLQALINAGLAGKPLVASIETHWNRDAPTTQPLARDVEGRAGRGRARARHPCPRFSVRRIRAGRASRPSRAPV